MSPAAAHTAVDETDALGAPTGLFEGDAHVQVRDCRNSTVSYAAPMAAAAPTWSLPVFGDCDGCPAEGAIVAATRLEDGGGNPLGIVATDMSMASFTRYLSFFTSLYAPHALTFIVSGEEGASTAPSAGTSSPGTSSGRATTSPRRNPRPARGPRSARSRRRASGPRIRSTRRRRRERQWRKLLGYRSRARGAPASPGHRGNGHYYGCEDGGLEQSAVGWTAGRPPATLGDAALYMALALAPSSRSSARCAWRRLMSKP